MPNPYRLIFGDNSDANYAGNDDNGIKSLSATTVFNVGNQEVTAWASGDNNRLIQRFSGIATAISANAFVGKKVVAARYIGQKNSGSNVSGNNLIEVYPLTRVPVAASCTWNSYDGTNPWTTPGGDYGSLLATVFVPTNGVRYVWDGAAITAIVAGWAAGGTNTGLLFKMQLDPAASSLNNSSSWIDDDSLTDGFRPALEVDLLPLSQASPSLYRRRSYKPDTNDFPPLATIGVSFGSPAALFDSLLQFPSGGGAVSVALTGVQGTGQVGTVGVQHDQALTGNAGTGSVGNVTPNTSIGLTGNAGTGSPGNVSPSGSVGLTGVQGTGAAGTVTPNTTVALTGVSGTGQVGTVTASTATVVALTGVQGTGQAGTLTPNTVVPLTGVEGTGQVGTVTASQATTAALTGVQGTGQAGTLSPSTTVALTGVQGTGQAGSVTANTSKALAGNGSTGSVGNVSPATTVALIGVQGTGQVGNVTFVGDVTVALTGVSGFGQVGNVSVPDANTVFGGSWFGQHPRKRKDLEEKVEEAATELLESVEPLPDTSMAEAMRKARQKASKHALKELDQAIEESSKREVERILREQEDEDDVELILSLL